MRIYSAKKPKLVCVFVWHLSLLVSISLDLRRLALRLVGWKISQTTAEKKKREEDQPRRIRRGDRPEKKEEEEAEEISNMGTACCLRLLLVCVVCVCIVFLLLSLSISNFFSLSKPESLFLSLLIHGFMGLIFHVFDSWVWFSMGSIHGFDSWVQFMGLIFHGFDSWVRFMGSCNLSTFDSWVWLFAKKINKRKENIDYFNFLGKFSSYFL